jgi:hypothetical protein
VAKDEDLSLAVSLVTHLSHSEDAAKHHVEEGEQHPRILRNRTLGDESRYWYPSGEFGEDPGEGPEEDRLNTVEAQAISALAWASSSRGRDLNP